MMKKDKSEYEVKDMDEVINYWEKEERYYWRTKDGRLIPVNELTDLHVCNIVMYFGKVQLSEAGYSVIVDRFENLNKEYNFFEKVMDK